MQSNKYTSVLKTKKPWLSTLASVCSEVTIFTSTGRLQNRHAHSNSISTLDEKKEKNSNC